VTPPMYAFANLLNTVISLYIWCLFIYVILGWLINFGVINTQNRIVYLVMDFLYRITEPALRPIRNFIPNLGGIDISPILLVLVLIFIRDFIVVDLAKMFG
jgi:YggT family protein